VEYLLKGLFGEQPLTKVVGLFPGREQAEAAAAKVRTASGLTATQARVLGPPHADLSRRELFGRSMEAGPRGMFKALLHAHGVTALAGALAGLLLLTWLYRDGQLMVASSPLLAFLAIIGLSIALGFLLGGFVALRPDQVWLVNVVRNALQQERWAVIVHPADARQTAVARQTLQQSGAEVFRSL
jgi:hypothetical protein